MQNGRLIAELEKVSEKYVVAYIKPPILYFAVRTEGTTMSHENRDMTSRGTLPKSD